MVPCAGWNNCSYIKQISSRLDVLFQFIIFPFYSWLKLTIGLKIIRKHLFSGEVHVAVGMVEFLSWAGPKKNKFDGTIGYGARTWNVHFIAPKVFRLHAVLYDAAGAVRRSSGKGPDYCYMMGRGRNSSLLDHVIGLLFSLYVKLFPLSTMSASEAVCRALYEIINLQIKL